MQSSNVAWAMLFSLCIPFWARAQDVAMEGTLPDSIVVTASRLSQDVRETGRRVTVWTAQDLATLPVTSFDELLRTVGGVEVQSRGGFGVQSDLTMRGSTFNGVLVLLDGARLNDPMTGHFLTDFPVPRSEIARIEVLRGPAAALYGPDALGGVVHILTYAGLANAKQLPRHVTGQIAARGGRFELYDVDAALRYGREQTRYSGATAWQGSDGQPIINEQGHAMQSSQGTVHTDFQRQAHTLALTHAFDRARLFVRAGMDDRDFGAFHFYTAFPSDTARESTSTLWAQARLTQEGSARTRWQAHVAARQHEDEYVYNPQTPPNQHTSRLLTGQAHISHTIRPNLTLTSGVSASLRGIDSNNLGQHDDASAGIFLTARWQPQPRLTINTSGRLDLDPGYGLEATPQVTAAYNRQAFTVRASVSRAVRAPNYVERYFNTTLNRPRGRSLGNPNLKAERAWAYEAGLDLHPAPGVSFHATLFHRTTRNLIDYVKLAPADTVWLARNLLNVTNRGLELDARLKQNLGPHRLRLTATYTRLDADLGEVEDGVAFKYALTNARHLLQSTAALDVAGLTVGLQALWKDRLAGTTYGVLQARMAYRFYLGDERLVISGEVRNLLDEQYAEVFDAPMPDRWWLFGAKLAF